MARSVQNAKLDSRTARDSLKPRARPYYTALIPGELHLGYRRRRKGKGAQGRWLVRRYLGTDAAGVGRYKEADIGLADDFLDADGVKILDYKQAQQIANEWRRKSAGGQPQPGGPLTVAGALENYFTYLEQEGRPPGNSRGRAAKHIVPALGSELVETLDSERLRRWLADMGKPQPHEDDERKRRRRSTANRVLTILRAALNHAFDEGLVNSNVAWSRRVRAFAQVDQPRSRFLTIAESKRLINASEPSFRQLVTAALSTGCRYGELCRVRVADFNPDTGTLAIWISKSGKARHVFLSDEGTAFFKQLTAGRSGGETMLRKANGAAWGGHDQDRPMARAVAQAKISPRITFHGLRHSFASLSVMAGVPLHVVARSLGHVDQRMVERVHGHMTDSYLKDEIKRGAPTFGLASDSKVVALGGSTAKGRRGK